MADAILVVVEQREGKLNRVSWETLVAGQVLAKETGWSLEAAIPWANFEEFSRRPPVAGSVWKANFNRWDGVQPNRRMSIWSDPQNAESWPHVPSRFGELVFVD